jgi:queuosine precursor transporter
MRKILKYKYSLAYLASILFASLLFKFYPLIITVAEGVQFSFWTLWIGAWFVLRDYCQRELGHFVFIPMITGVLILIVIDPSLAIASLLASSASELADWAIYTFTKKPFHQRILISSLVSAPVDTMIFFAAFDYFEIIPGVSVFNWAAVALGVLSKLVAAVVVYYWYRHKKVCITA